jgi:hypothetical protein
MMIRHRDYRGLDAHSVAFRVSETQWLQLQQLAKQRGLSVAGLARDLILEVLQKKQHGQARGSVLRRER